MARVVAKPWGDSRKLNAADYEYVAELVRVIDAVREQDGGGARRGRIDGRWTVDDVMASAALMVEFVVGGALIWATNDMEYVGDMTAVGVYVTLAREVADTMDLPYWAERIAEGFGRGVSRFVQPPAQTNGDGEPIRLVPYQGPPLKEMPQPPYRNGDSRFELADGRTMSKRELLQFLSTALDTGDWTRSGWCGGDGKAGRGMSQPSWYALRDTLQTLDVWETEDRPALRAFVEKVQDA